MIQIDIARTMETAGALHQAGRLDEAEGLCRQVLAVDPDHAHGLHLLGIIAHQRGHNELAVDLIGKAIARNDGVADFHSNIGIALGALGRIGEAEAHYRQAISLDPQHAASHNNFGHLLTDQGRLEEAQWHLRQSLELEPQHASVHYNLGNNLKAKGRYEEAIVHYKQSIVRRPDFGDAWNNMGVAFAERGDLDAARDAYQKAVEVDPTRASYHRNLAHTKRFQPDDPQLAVMEGLARNLMSDLHFALGKAYADLKQHDRSFQHLLAGNAVKRAQIVYSEAETLGYMQRIRNVFNADLLRAKNGDGDSARTPVFIVGMPRSGTTLIEQIIASHPKASGLPHSPRWRYCPSR